MRSHSLFYLLLFACFTAAQSFSLAPGAVSLDKHTGANTLHERSCSELWRQQGPRPFSRTVCAQPLAKGSTPRDEFDWRKSARPVANGRYPAREHCSHCGLCDSYFVAKVKEACPFLGEGMSRLEDMEQHVHNRSSEGASDDELYFGVHDVMLAARVTRPIVGAQWGGLVTTIACRMLETGHADAVLCVGSDPDDRFSPRPMLARTPEQVLACKGVKPVLASLLELLPLIDGRWGLVVLRGVRWCLVAMQGAPVSLFLCNQSHNAKAYLLTALDCGGNHLAPR